MKKTITFLLLILFAFVLQPNQVIGAVDETQKTFIVQKDGTELGQFNQLSEAIERAEKEPEKTKITILQTKDFDQNRDTNVCHIKNTYITLKSNDDKLRRTITSKDGEKVCSVSSQLTVENMIVDGNQKASAFSVISDGANSGTLILNHCSIVHCTTQESGGAIHSESNCQMTLIDTSFTNNSAEEFGGAIYAGGPLSINACTFEENKAPTGGALYCEEGEVSLVNISFKKNIATNVGGAIFSNRGTKITIDGGSFIENMAQEDGHGGGLCIYNQAVSLKNITFEKNTASSGGAADIGFTRHVTIENCIFKNNATSENGGALNLSYLDGEIKNNAFENNFAINKGGGLFVDTCTLNFSNTRFINNGNNGDQITKKGGGIYTSFVPKAMRLSLDSFEDDEDYDEPFDYDDSDFSNKLTFNQCRFEKNMADNGGAAYFHDADNTLNTTTLSHNMATNAGGGIYLSEAKARFSHSSVIDNGKLKTPDGDKLTTFGGAIFTDDYDYNNPASQDKYRNLTIDNQTVFKNNKAAFLSDAPENASDFSALAFQSTSLSGVKNPYDKTKPLLKRDSLLNNYDINYKASPEMDMREISYKFVSDTGRALPKDVQALLPKTHKAYEGTLIIPPILEKTSVSTADGTWIFTGWDKIKAIVAKEDILLTGTWSLEKKPVPHNRGLISVVPVLNTEEHFAYLKGYPNGSFMPNTAMRRAEVAVIFARLMNDRFDAKGIEARDFFDLDPNGWYVKDIAYATRQGVVKGYPDGSFKPNAPITRAEFAALASRFTPDKGAKTPTFSDLDHGHWAYKDIAQATHQGWLNGYPDGSFKPDAPITRAEVVTIVNRMLNRWGDHAWFTAHKNAILNYPDVKDNDWFYDAIMEASMGHDFKRDKDGKREHWIRLNGKNFF